jgi:hypothetical protein
MNKITQNSPTKFLVFLAILLSLAIITPSCGDTEEPVVTGEQDVDDVINGFATDKISHTHVIGTDPCPQDVFSKIKVYCYKTQTQTACDADSVVITNPSTGLTATIGGQSYATFSGPTDSKDIDVVFTCGIAKSFKHSYTLVFYLEGVKVDEENVVVDVTVVE